MKMRKNHVWMMLAAGLALVARLAPGQATPAAPDAAAKPAAAKTFAFKAGDRVVLIGNTVLERDQTYGCLESTLALALGDTAVTVRNLAWSGDTVFGHARSYFGPPSEGLDRLSSHVEMIKPTVAILCYGSEMAFERLGGLPDFLTAYRQLLDRIRSKSPGVRFVIVSPPPLETLPPPSQIRPMPTAICRACVMRCESSPSCRMRSSSTGLSSWAVCQRRAGPRSR